MNTASIPAHFLKAAQLIELTKEETKIKRLKEDLAHELHQELLSLGLDPKGIAIPGAGKIQLRRTVSFTFSTPEVESAWKTSVTQSRTNTKAINEHLQENGSYPEGVIASEKVTPIVKVDGDDASEEEE